VPNGNVRFYLGVFFDINSDSSCYRLISIGFLVLSQSFSFSLFLFTTYINTSLLLWDGCCNRLSGLSPPSFHSCYNSRYKPLLPLVTNVHYYCWTSWNHLVPSKVPSVCKKELFLFRMIWFIFSVLLPTHNCVFRCRVDHHGV